jgi:chemotaxis protein histidine kinase CheA
VYRLAATRRDWKDLIVQLFLGILHNESKHEFLVTPDPVLVATFDQFKMETLDDKFRVRMTLTNMTSAFGDSKFATEICKPLLTTASNNCSETRAPATRWKACFDLLRAVRESYGDEELIDAYGVACLHVYNHFVECNRRLTQLYGPRQVVWLQPRRGGDVFRSLVLRVSSTESAPSVLVTLEDTVKGNRMVETYLVTDMTKLIVVRKEKFAVTDNKFEFTWKEEKLYADPLTQQDKDEDEQPNGTNKESTVMATSDVANFSPNCYDQYEALLCKEDSSIVIGRVFPEQPKLKVKTPKKKREAKKDESETESDEEKEEPKEKKKKVKKPETPVAVAKKPEEKKEKKKETPKPASPSATPAPASKKPKRKAEEDDAKKEKKGKKKPSSSSSSSSSAPAPKRQHKEPGPIDVQSLAEMMSEKPLVPAPAPVPLPPVQLPTVEVPTVVLTDDMFASQMVDTEEPAPAPAPSKVNVDLTEDTQPQE